MILTSQIHIVFPTGKVHNAPVHSSAQPQGVSGKLHLHHWHHHAHHQNSAEISRHWSL